MGSTPTRDDTALLTIAASIARGDEVDWGRVDETTAPADLIHALKAIDHVASKSDRMPDTWGRATITSELGRGTFGTVYAAHDPDLGIDIALKVVRTPGVDRSARIAAALNEAKLLARLSHPNIVRVFWAEAKGHEVGVAMELVQGRTLRDMLRQRGAMSTAEVTDIGIDLCRALDAVHSANLLHGDIKASNVMRTPAARTVLMDFGVGQDLERDDARIASRAGTPHYLAPELYRGEERSRQSDLYSLGVLLFHLATNQYPIDAREASDVDRHHSSRRPTRRLADLRSDLPRAFVEVVDRATAPDPADRFASAAAFEAALQRTRRTGRGTRPLWSWPAAAAVTASALMMGLGYLASTRPRPAAEPAPVQAATPIVPATPSDSYEIDVALYRHEKRSAVRLTSGSRVSPNDELSLRIAASTPVYAYVVNEDDRGTSFLLFPLPDQQLKNPLPPGTRHELPGVVGRDSVRWQVSTTGGREHFLIFISREPPTPALERVFASLPRPVLGAPVLASPTSPELVTQLRGVGGLAKVPTNLASHRLAEEFAVPLPEGKETARGVWVRQLTLENPGK